MSLPPGFLDELRSRTSLGQVVGRKVIWDARKSNQGKGDMWAPCPFHQEKTASFHVDDRKGFYYCFGCHAKGDAITFVRETENMSFMEAIETLAREAGMPIPAIDPEARQKADNRTKLTEIMEQAVQYYRLQLKTAQAQKARSYLAGRGLSEGALERWDIGFAADVRQGVFGHLTGKGVPAELIIDAGLAATPDDGGQPYDRFRGRIIFPIRDARGRAIALGGRAMDVNARAKYLNSPETLLFDKGRSLYNQGPARDAAGKGQPLLVAEGYMDVIALSEAGFGATVAPLGTAITQDQLRLLWRISPEPIIALDGDTAGLRAALRLIDLALPMLEAGRSLRFALLPEGLDPDDLLRAQGSAAMQRLVDEAQPLISLLWRRETEGRVFDSPERRAALDKSLREAIRKIPDPSVRGHYGDAIKRLRWDLFDTRRPAPAKGRWNAAPVAPTPGTKNSMLAGGARFEEALHEAVILATLILHPKLLERFESALERLVFSRHDNAVIRDALLRHITAPPENLREKIVVDLGPDALEKLLAPSHVSLAPTVRDPGNIEMAALCVNEELAKLQTRRGVQREIDDAKKDLSGVADEGLTWRLQQAAEARNRAVLSKNDDTTEYDTGDNGVAMSRKERSRFEELLNKIDYAKPPNRRN
ncbi:MAG: DNA primase [Halocynthiibacter sp.]